MGVVPLSLKSESRKGPVVSLVQFAMISFLTALYWICPS
jgi:hypothetical protein